MRKALIGVALAATWAAAGCGAGTSDSDTASDTITIGTIPVADFAAAYVAQSQGYFEDEGLTVELSAMQNAASIVPSVLNGQVTVGTAASVPFVTAVGEGLPVGAITVASSTYGDGSKETKDIYVANDSPIKDAGDLVGKRVGVNALRAVLELGVHHAVATAGGNPNDVNFLAMPFPDMLPALKSGRIDAAALDEPFRTQAEEAGMVGIAPLFADLPANSPNAVFFVSNKFAAEKPDVLEKIQSAIRKGLEYAADNPDAVREALGEFSQIPPETIAEMRLPNFNPDVEVADLAGTAELMKEYGFIDQVPDSDALQGK